MNRQLKRDLLAILIFFSVYLTATIIQSDFWGNLLSPIGDLLAAFIILRSIRTGSGRYHLIGIVFALAMFSWAAADILWAAVEYVCRINPDNSPAVITLYTMTTAFMLIAAGKFCSYRFRKWDTVQLFLDAAATSVTVVWLLWVLIFHKRPSELGMLINNNAIHVAGILLDFILIIGLLVCYLSARGGKVPVYLRIISVSIFIYALTDLCCDYLYMKNRYIPNSLIDAAYMATLFGVAMGMRYYSVSKPDSENREELISNIGYRKKIWLLLPAPVLVLIINGPDIPDVFLFLVIFLIHDGLSGYIQTAIKNKELLTRELNINNELEKCIADRTKDLKQKNRELAYLSEHDALTGLYNRGHFLRKVDDIIKGLDGKGKLVLLLLNVDRLKTINDLYGHNTGDQLLIALAGRMLSFHENNDGVARLAGDEFAYMISGDLNRGEIETIAKKVAQICHEAIKIGQYTFQASISIGISVYPTDAGSRDELLSNADVAMVHAKTQKSMEGISFYDSISETVRRKNLIEDLLKRANYDREFELYYQPQFRISDRKLIGMEALIRWNSPAHGPIPPAEFIPIAEEQDLIISLSNWVIEKGILQISKWNRLFHSNLKVGINMSPKQLDQSDFMEIFKSTLDRYEASPEWIDIEITEGVALTGNNNAARLMKYFQQRGGSVSIDDFGTGYASLGYLKILSFNRIKIAKPLIDHIETDELNYKIVSSIILLAKSLEISTLAEGVENEEQLKLLSDLKCDQVQGYCLGRPIPADRMESLLKSGSLIYETQTDKEPGPLKANSPFSRPETAAAGLPDSGCP